MVEQQRWRIWAADGGDRSRREAEEEENSAWPTTMAFIGMAGRLRNDTRSELTVTRRSRNAASAPGSGAKVAGVVGRWRAVIDENFK
jgi:hypothetical protein